ncbi:pseudouridine synthase [Adlercreutzia sp. ZJ138]|uniref:pseudouridine synthase n=1 Tax=Adlercreutzia sp. ZJ138 TaxID=2709405 RepID=UPI0013EDFD68|nr:pseudouridine synthase [Adlercreutzia sp. ZJ138]
MNKLTGAAGTGAGNPQESERLVPMRLQKFLARAGVASRRGSENLMTAGRVTVNGQVVTELGSKVDPRVDTVAVDGKLVRLTQGATTLMLHKPLGVLTTMSDPQGRPTVASLVPTNDYPGLFPVGRLDQDTTGLLLFSTDGELGHGLLRPRGHVDKTYLALVDGVPSPCQLQALRDGVPLDDGMTLPARVELLHGECERSALTLLDAPSPVPPGASKQYARICRQRAARRSVVRITIHEGRNRQVRRMLQFVGHPVLALHRESFGPVSLDPVRTPRGTWCELFPEEVAALHAAIKAGEQR